MLEASEINPNLSLAYDIQPDEPISCLICYSNFDEKDILICSCGHKFCRECLLDYLQISKETSKFFPMKCPSNQCEVDIFKVFKHIIEKIHYKNLKNIRKTFKVLKLRNVYWCGKENCEGYTIIPNNKKSGHCNLCNSLIFINIDYEENLIKQELPVVSCPKCRTLIYKDLFCLKLTCLCGTQFCVKCERSNKLHSNYSCFVRNKGGRINWWIVLICIYSYVLFPFFPGFFVLIYHQNWNSNRTKFLNNNYWKKASLLMAASPILLFTGFFYATFKANSLCLDVLFDEKSIKGYLRYIKITLFPFAFVLVSLAILLIVGLFIVNLPIFGIYLLTKILL